MPDPLQLALNLPFQEQIDFFRAKLNLPTERWDDIWKEAHDRAFVVAGAMKADLLDDLRKAVDPLQRTTLEVFRKDFSAIVAKRGWTGWTGEGSKAGEAWRTKVIFETNVRSSHAAGRYKQLTDPDTLAAMPYWRYVHNDSVMHPREEHKAWHGLTLPATHEFWQTHFAPNGWGCRCKIVAQSQPGKGDKATPPDGWDAINAKTGEQAGIDKGWGYAPGANAATPLRELIDKKLLNLDAPIGAAMWQNLKPALALERELAWYDALDAWRATGQIGAPRTHAVGALDAKTLFWLAERQQVFPVSAEIAVQDKLVLGLKERRHQAAGDGLTDAEWRRLPELLDAPQQILYDTRSGHLLYIGDAGDAAEKLAVEFDFRVDKSADTRMNLIVSAYRQRLSDIDGQIKGGVWQVIE